MIAVAVAVVIVTMVTSGMPWFDQTTVKRIPHLFSARLPLWYESVDGSGFPVTSQVISTLPPWSPTSGCMLQWVMFGFSARKIPVN